MILIHRDNFGEVSDNSLVLVDDVSPPAAINDLTAGFEAAADTVQITFTSTGDDDNSGTGSWTRYETIFEKRILFNLSKPPAWTCVYPLLPSPTPTLPLPL